MGCTVGIRDRTSRPPRYPAKAPWAVGAEIFAHPPGPRHMEFHGKKEKKDHLKNVELLHAAIQWK